MDNPIIRRLEGFTRLSRDEKQALAEAASQRVRRLGAREDILVEGELPRDVHLVLDGWACRYKTLEDGRRQIIAFLVPGDTCDPHTLAFREMDHSLGALTAVTLAEISREGLQSLTETSPRLRQALVWTMLVALAVQQEWTVSLGQRTALERLGHLFCELFLRLRAVGLTDGNSCELPLTQGDLGDATGLSNVHVNRVLQVLRNSGLIILKGRILTIPDLARLQEVSLFSATYLHLDREGGSLDANEP
ncbi:Crp/Fnr family transcriptional regulator [Methylobacterium planeticum]|uniref:Crp/Fnr family transcriptional regulator n=1 Tax=Methylobacterium planeticum TaxID=2615211 RepID=A0A6N6MPP9_9HYPH|nr:Crp/Fnr family transcriptional regulator [Methylobacterium planeticum]KAB1073364.1 Crp/Fnr family transcriptional regulator [Methylobacterium planeticum]